MNKIQSIQALRGLAVILVVLGHWGLLFESGFIGVDVFFVISGYVVTLASLRRARSDAFTVSQFLQARFLRLFPALGGVVLVVVSFQLIYYPSFERARASEEGIWSILWMSNVFSHVRTGDYFGETAGTSLLLHTWSLSVEFQSYIVLAILYFWALVKNKNVKHLQFALAILISASLAVAVASQLASTNNIWQAVSSYYSPATRFYQIGAGALLATLSVVPGKKRWGVNHFFGGLMVVSLGLLPEKLISWNLAGILAVIGATMFILLVNSGLKASLTERSLAKVGDYSYSIYLWHWPILVVVESAVPGEIEQICIGATLTTVFAFLSYRFLELPFMGSSNRVLVTQTKVISTFGAAAAFLLVLSSASYVWSPIKPTEYESVSGVLAGDVTQLSFANSFNEIVRPCSSANSKFSANIGTVFDCYETSSSDQIDILVIGNSHAGHLVPGLVSVAPKVKLRYLSFSGGFQSGNSDLQRAMDYWVSSGSTSKSLYINSFWEIENTDTDVILRTIALSKVSPSKTYIFDDVPNFKISPTRCKYSVLFLVPAPCREMLSSFTQHLSDFRISINDKLPLVNMISSSEFFRDENDTYFMSSGQAIYFRDQNHLNVLGSRALFEWLVGTKLILGQN